MSSRQKSVKVGGENSVYGTIEKLTLYYKKPNYPGQGSAGLTKLSIIPERGQVSNVRWLIYRELGSNQE
jgi:hypothetical protein